MLGGYFNACNKIENLNSMQKYSRVIEKHWLTHSVYFRLETTVVLGMGITDKNLLLCNGISGKTRENRVSMRDYNTIIVYDCFKTPFPVDRGSPALNTPPTTLDNGSRPKKLL